MSPRRAGLLALALMLAGWPAVAWSHAALVKSSPPRRATLSEAPARVELVFNERLEPAYARLSVEDAGGTRVDLADAAVSPEDGRRLTVSLPRLGPGTYTVRFRVLSVDGHVVEARFPFFVKPRP
jgi:methionine-rich copper-binding protein CopC